MMSLEHELWEKVLEDPEVQARLKELVAKPPKPKKPRKSAPLTGEQLELFPGFVKVGLTNKEPKK